MRKKSGSEQLIMRRRLIIKRRLVRQRRLNAVNAHTRGEMHFPRCPAVAFLDVSPQAPGVVNRE
jgi:hypothetical protein